MTARDPQLSALCDKISALIEAEIAASALPDTEYCVIVCNEQSMETAVDANLSAMMDAMTTICTDWIEGGLIDISGNAPAHH